MLTTILGLGVSDVQNFRVIRPVVSEISSGQTDVRTCTYVQTDESLLYIGHRKPDEIWCQLQLLNCKPSSPVVRASAWHGHWLRGGYCCCAAKVGFSLSILETALMLTFESGTYTRCQLLMVSHEMGNKTTTDIRVTRVIWQSLRLWGSEPLHWEEIRAVECSSAACRNQVPGSAVAETWPKPKPGRKSFRGSFGAVTEAIAEIRSASKLN